MEPEKIIQFLHWDLTKNLDDFLEVERNLRSEGHESRADAVLYLVERCKLMEAELDKLSKKSDSLVSSAYDRGYNDGKYAFSCCGAGLCK